MKEIEARGEIEGKPFSLNPAELTNVISTEINGLVDQKLKGKEITFQEKSKIELGRGAIKTLKKIKETDSSIQIENGNVPYLFEKALNLIYLSEFKENRTFFTLLKNIVESENYKHKFPYETSKRLGNCLYKLGLVNPTEYGDVLGGYTVDPNAIVPSIEDKLRPKKLSDEEEFKKGYEFSRNNPDGGVYSAKINLTYKNGDKESKPLNGINIKEVVGEIKKSDTTVIMSPKDHGKLLAFVDNTIKNLAREKNVSPSGVTDQYLERIFSGLSILEILNGHLEDTKTRINDLKSKYPLLENRIQELQGIYL